MNRSERLAQMRAQNQDTSKPEVESDFDDVEEEPAVETRTTEVARGETAPRHAEARTGEATRTRIRGLFNGTAKKLDVTSKIPGYVLRWVNDIEGRPQMREAGGWEFVKKGELTLPLALQVTTASQDTGDNIRRTAGAMGGEPLYAYLMKIKEEWFKEDLDDYAASVQEREDEMIRRHGADAGAIDQLRVPAGTKALNIRRT